MKDTAVRTVEAKPFHMAPVDIIVPYTGHYSAVSRTVEEIFLTVWSNRYQVTLVDDASPNAAYKDYFKKIPGVVTLRNDAPVGFAESVNRAVAATKQPYVLVVRPGVRFHGMRWLTDLGRALFRMRPDGVKMVGPGDEDKIIDDGFLPLDCVLCHRKLFESAGPLRGAEEFAKAVRVAGHRQAFCIVSGLTRKMADNFPQTPGSGRNVAADLVKIPPEG